MSIGGVDSIISVLGHLFEKLKCEPYLSHLKGNRYSYGDLGHTLVFEVEIPLEQGFLGRGERI